MDCVYTEITKYCIKQAALEVVHYCPRMATLRSASRVGAAIPKCRLQSTATVINATEEALPFEEIPTFKSTKWPLIGQLPALMKVSPELYKKEGFAKGTELK